MYPKVKVRAVEVDNDEYDRAICIRDFNSLTIPDVGPPGKESKNASSLPVSKVPISYIRRRPMTPPHPLQKVPQMTTSKKNEDGSKPQIRASSVPRPRAVVSSPDNDQLIRSSNKLRFERPSTPKSQNTTQSKHLISTSRNSEGRCSSIVTPWKPLKSEIRPKETVLISDHSKGKKGSLTDVRVPRSDIVKSKPCFRV